VNVKQVKCIMYVKVASHPFLTFKTREKKNNTRKPARAGFGLAYN
jgi:hypothetical protein